MHCACRLYIISLRITRAQERACWCHAEVCTNHTVLFAAALALPYVWRCVQCLSVARRDKDRWQVLNAIKYCSALPVVFLRLVKYQVPPPASTAFWKPLWVLSCVVNTTYSFYWDVERDWDIRLFTPGARCLRMHAAARRPCLRMHAAARRPCLRMHAAARRPCLRMHAALFGLPCNRSLACSLALPGAVQQQRRTLQEHARERKRFWQPAERQRF
jgi:hypothetical protein